MKKIHLDTSFLIQAVDPGTPEDKLLRGWLTARIPIAMSVVAWAEFLCGPVSEEELELSRLLVGSLVPLTEADALKTAELFNSSGRRRGCLADCMIAAAAIRSVATLATSNPKDFRIFSEAGLLDVVVPKSDPIVH